MPSITENKEFSENVIYTPANESELIKSFGGLGKFVFDVSRKYSENIAQIEASTGKTETYGHLNNRCIQLALELKALGLAPGDIITICSLNSMDVCVPFISGLYLGAVLSFLDPTVSQSTTCYLLSQVKPKFIFCTQDSVELLRNALKSNNYDVDMFVLDFGDSYSRFFESPKDDKEYQQFQPYVPESVKETAMILFSSGTTGLAKGICLNHYGILRSTGYDINTCAGIDVLLNFTTFYCMSGVNNFFFAYLIGGGTRIIVSYFDADTALEILERYKVSFTITSSLMVHYLQAKDYQKYDLSRLKYVGIGSTPSTAKQLEMAKKLFPHSVVLHAYGMTELSGILMCFYDPVKFRRFIDTKPDSVGKPMPGLAAKVVDIATEKTLGPNQQGELRIKSPAIMNGYHNRDSSEAWDSDGWLCTGDVGYYDEEGCFYIADRIKDMLKFQTWHVAPSAIEGVLMEHPSVKEAVVVGVPHEIDGDLATGIVVLKDDIDNNGNAGTVAEELIKFVEDRLGFRDRLHGGLRFVRSIPRTPTGKSRRRDIRIMLQEGKI